MEQIWNELNDDGALLEYPGSPPYISPDFFDENVDNIPGTPSEASEKDVQEPEREDHHELVVQNEEVVEFLNQLPDDYKQDILETEFDLVQLLKFDIPKNTAKKEELQSLVHDKAELQQAKDDLDVNLNIVTVILELQAYVHENENAAPNDAKIETYAEISDILLLAINSCNDQINLRSKID